jgi:tRNA dimethylallyltransferase
MTKKLNTDSGKPKIIVVLGATATGKSDAAVKLAKDFNGEIISADSRQVYKGLDIGSGKITENEMRDIPHHLLDVVSVDKVFTVADFQKLAYVAIDDILSRGKLPIIAGGTAFYIQSIVDGIVFPEIKTDTKLRNELEKLSLEELQQKLEETDLERFSEIDTKNKVRLVRALEINSQLEKVPELVKKPKYDVTQVGLYWPKEILHQRIHDRLTSRMENGMVEEVRNLHESGISWERLESLGLEYKYIALFLQDKITEEEMLIELETKIKQFAKRQMTWWKKDESIRWFNPDKYKLINNKVTKFII